MQHSSAVQRGVFLKDLLATGVGYLAHSIWGCKERARLLCRIFCIPRCVGNQMLTIIKEL